jgi:tetratricopeptide (TPR) repeat protein
MKSIKIVNLLLISSFLFFIFGACEEKSDNIPTFSSAPNVTSLVDQGWQEFRNKNFDLAADLFLQANERDALFIESYVGLGWSYAKIKSFNLARANFAKAMTFGVNDNDVLAYSHAGLAGVDLAEKNFEAAIDNVDMALIYKPEFELAQDPTINKNDLYLVVAQAYFSLEKFYKSVDFVERLSPGFLSSSPNINAVAETLLPGTSDDTEINGEATLTTSNDKLVYIGSLVNVDISTANISILDVTDGGNRIEFFSNPIPTATDQYAVQYNYAENYGVYIADLTKKLEEIKNQLN